MARYGTYTNTRKSQTPQTERMPGREDQVQNSAGGYSFAVDNWVRLDRFLVLGSEGGSYYANERKLTLDNLGSIDICIAEDGARTVNRIVEISQGGRAPKNTPALVALAKCASAGGSNPSPSDLETRRLALEALPKVARIGTHLFEFAHFVDGMRGWGTALRNAVAAWYNDKPVDKVAYQVIKYQARVADEGQKSSRWSHRDLFRKAHPQSGGDKARNKLYGYVTQGWDKIPTRVSKGLEMVKGFEKAKKATSAKEIVALIEEYNLPREAIPTQFLRDPAVWSAMLPNMPLTAMIRNLGNMSKAGIVAPLSEGEGIVLTKLADQEYLRKSRVHPLGVLVALKTYEQGHGHRGSNSWDVNQNIVDALDGAFYKTFDNIDPTGKRFYLGLDVSGSMGWPDIAGMPGISPRVGAAAMAMVTARSESRYYMAAFTDSMRKLDIGKRDSLDTVLRKTDNLPFGGTDCALPMIDALSKGMEVDTFVIYTDSETWAGYKHPVEALRDYRAKVNPEAKLVVCGMTSNGFSIADPKDAGMLDVVGFDTATPNIIADFATQEISQ